MLARPPAPQDAGSGDHLDGGNNVVSCEDVNAEPDCYDILEQAPCVARPYCAFVNDMCYDRITDLADMTCSEFTDEDACGQTAARCTWNDAEMACNSLPCSNFASDIYLCQSQVKQKHHSLPLFLPVCVQKPSKQACAENSPLACPMIVVACAGGSL